MAHDRDVGGIRCLEVLEHLSGYLDGDLDPALAARIAEHLDGCDWCEQFGGRFAETVADLRRLLGQAEPISAEVAERLRARLQKAAEDGSGER